MIYFVRTKGSAKEGGVKLLDITEQPMGYQVTVDKICIALFDLIISHTIAMNILKNQNLERNCNISLLLH